MKSNICQTVEDDIATFRRIRKTIGYLGMLLPFVLVLFSLIPFFNTVIQQSVSAYYYTNLREIFTGTLCAVSLFLIRYKGVSNPVFWKDDNRMTNLAGIMALGVALFPTNPVHCCDKIYTLIPVCARFLGYFHYIFAGVFFCTLAVISIWIFTIGQNHDVSVRIHFLNENNIYRVCGYMILGCVLLIPLSKALNSFPCSTLIFEALSLVAFGVSWLVKGRFLGDRGKLGLILYRERNDG